MGEWTTAVWFKGFNNDSSNSRILMQGSYGVVWVKAGSNELSLALLDDVATDLATGFEFQANEWQGEWHQLTVVGRVSSTEFYFDGELVGIVEQRGLGNATYFVGGSGGENRFAEQLDELQLYELALTPEEVRSLFASTALSRTTATEVSFGIQGVEPSESLSSFQLIGDFNDDGHDDFIASSQSTSYVMFGPVDLQGMERVNSVADIIIDHELFGRPASSFGDINNDGVADFAFVQKQAGDTVVTIVYGGQTGRVVGQGTSATQVLWPRNWDTKLLSEFTYVDSVGQVKVVNDSFFGTENSGRIVLSSAPLAPNASSPFSSAGTTTVHLMDMTGDSFDDVLVLSNSTLQAESTVSGKYTLGYVFSGSNLTVKHELTLVDQHASLRLDREIPVLPSIAGGDFNGDGIDELLIGGQIFGIDVEQVERAMFQTEPKRHVGFPSSLEIKLNGDDKLQAIIPVEVDTQFPATSRQFAEEINRQLSATILSGKVFAAEIGGRLLLGSIDGGPDVTLTVAERLPRMPLGFTTPVVKSSTATSVQVESTDFASPVAGLTSEMTVKYQNNPTTLVITPTSSSLEAAVDSINLQLNARGPTVQHLDHVYEGLSPSAWVNRVFPHWTLRTFGPNGITQAAQGIQFAGAAEILSTQAFDPFQGSVTVRGKWTFFRELDAMHLVTRSTSAALIGNRISNGIETILDAGANTLRIISRVNGVETKSVQVPFVATTGPWYEFEIIDNGHSVTARIWQPGGSTPTQVTLSGLNSTLRNTSRFVAFYNNDFNSGGFSALGRIEITQTAVYAERLSDKIRFTAQSVTPGVQLEVSEVVPRAPLGFSQSGETTAGALRSPKLSYVAPLITGLDGDGLQRVTISAANASSQPLALGDINGDGFEDVGLSSSGRISVHLGGPSLDRPFSVASESFAVTFESGDANNAAVTGDFNGDGQMDLAAISAELEPNGLIGVFYSIAHPPSSRTFYEADVVFPLDGLSGPFDTTTFQLKHDGSFFLSPSIDLNADGIDDLVVNARLATDDTGNQVGRSYVIYGARRRGLVPGNFQVLENISFPGSGAFVADRSGIPVMFDNGGQPYELPVSETWFQFSTLGDGKAGNYIRFDGDVTADLLTADGGLILSQQSIFDLRTVKAGTYFMRVSGATGEQFRIEFAPPNRGQTHETSELPDRDTLRGGDGDDYIEGSHDLDRVFGGSGADQIIAEPVEIRDRDIADQAFTTTLPDKSELSFGNPAPMIDPLVEIPNPKLRFAIAKALEYPVAQSEYVLQLDGARNTSMWATIPYMASSKTRSRFPPGSESTSSPRNGKRF